MCSKANIRIIVFNILFIKNCLFLAVYFYTQILNEQFYICLVSIIIGFYYILQLEPSESFGPILPFNLGFVIPIYAWTNGDGRALHGCDDKHNHNRICTIPFSPINVYMLNFLFFCLYLVCVWVSVYVYIIILMLVHFPHDARNFKRGELGL